MIQVRKNIFETNSSTTHCLVIGKTQTLQKKIEEFKKTNGNKIVFGKNPYDEVRERMYNDPTIDENTSFQDKADILYFSMYVWTDCSTVADFLEHRQQLTDKLNELGFEVEYHEDPEVLKNSGYSRYDVENNMFEEMWHDVNEVIYYLFNDHVLYYSWCDECCQECPESIEEAIERFGKYEDNNEEMIIHHYR